MPESNIQPKTLLVEGKDEVNFFDALLKHWAIDGVEVQAVGGKGNFPDKLSAFLLTYGNQVQAYGIIRDADQSSDAAFQSVIALLRNHGEPIPNKIGGFGESKTRRVGVFIMPGNLDEGMLEDLCLQTVAEHPVMACTDQYFSCLERLLTPIVLGQPKEADHYYFPKNPSKAKAQAFLAGLHETHPSVGVAAKKGCWNFDHPALADLKAFLAGL